MAGVRDCIDEQLTRASNATPMALEALFAGEPVIASNDVVLASLMSIVQAQRLALLYLAAEIDELRG